MKPFNIEAAKAGKPVVARNGKPVRIICFDRNCPGYKIVGFISVNNEEHLKEWDAKGKSDDCEAFDLFMARPKDLQGQYLNQTKTKNNKAKWEKSQKSLFR